jgi:hypothetical protein
MEHYPFDIFEKLLRAPSQKEGTCSLLIVHYKDKQGDRYTKDYGIFLDIKILNKHIADIRELINRDTNYEIDINAKADHFLYYLKEMFDYENSVIDYEVKQLKLYE